MGIMDDEFVRVTSDLERAGSVLSLFGSFFIIVTFSCFPAFQKKPINRLVFFASFGNIVANVATLMAGRYVDNPGSVGCQLQGAMIQMYMPADAFWALAMAINVWLTFYRKWDSRELRKMEWRYLCLCYGIPFVPALIFIFISSPSRGRVYGDARLWCWVTENWAPLRFGVFYGPVWVSILITFFIYVRAGRELYATRKKLQEFSTGTTSIPDSEYFSMADPYSAKANEVVASREPTYDALNSPGGRGTAWGRSSRPGRGQGQIVGEFPVITGVSQPTTPGGYPSKKSLDANSAAAAAAAAEIGAKTQTFDFSLGAPTCPNAAKAGGESPTGLQGRRARAPTNINLSGLAPPSMLDTPLASPASFVNTLRPVSTNDTRRRDQFRSMLKFQRSSRASALAANSAAWSYTKCAMLFFTVMCITWIPSSANRIYNLASGGQTSPVLLYMTSIVLPIQGFWNCVIYCVTSREAVKLMLSDLWDVVGPWICCGRARRRMRGQQALADEQEQQQQQQLQFQQLQQYQQFQFEFQQQQQQRQQQQQGGGAAGTGGGGQQHALEEISEHDSDEHPDWELVTPPRRSFQIANQQTTVSGQKTKIQRFVMLSPPIEDLPGHHHDNKHELSPSGSGSGRGGHADDEDDEHEKGEEEEEVVEEDENRGRDRKSRSTHRGDISATTSTTRLTNSSSSPEPPQAQGSSSSSKSVRSR